MNGPRYDHAVCLAWSTRRGTHPSTLRASLQTSSSRARGRIISKNISLRIPHNQVTAITGVSGSGKSSLAFDTLFAEEPMALCRIALHLCPHVSR